MSTLFWIGAAIGAFGIWLVLHGMFAPLQIQCSRRREFIMLGGHVILIALPIMVAGLILDSWSGAPITVAAGGIMCLSLSWKIPGSPDEPGLRLRHAWQFVGMGLVLAAVLSMRDTTFHAVGNPSTPSTQPQDQRR